MKRITFLSKPARWALQILVWTAALAFVACDNDVNFNPVAPAFPNFAAFPDATTAGPGRTVEILGTLTAEQGACIEATVLYDDEELEGGRAVCSDASGCAKLELSAEVLSTTGDHTISFQVLSQSSEPVEYLAKGRVLVFREGLPLVTTIVLEPTRATLRAGESVTFDVKFQNYVN